MTFGYLSSRTKPRDLFIERRQHEQLASLRSGRRLWRTIRAGTHLSTKPASNRN